jgi:hypothetical protein
MKQNKDAITFTKLAVTIVYILSLLVSVFFYKSLLSSTTSIYDNERLNSKIDCISQGKEIC